MLTAYDQSNHKIYAQHASKSESYFCPICKEQLVLKQGTSKIAHFAHQHRHNHPKHLSESIEHQRYKLQLYQQSVSAGYTPELEVYLPEIQQIPDLLVEQLAIEIQLSPISVDDLQQRTQGLQKLGYRVIWVTRLPPFKKELYHLTQLHQACINLRYTHLICIHPHTFQLIQLSHLMPVTSKQFYAKRISTSITACVEETFTPVFDHQVISQLTQTQMRMYLMQCRRKNSVLQPTLSMMYQLRLTDQQVFKLTGFIFPEQIYIRTHPIEWQLQILYAKKLKQSLFNHLLTTLKFRTFYSGKMHKPTIITKLIDAYERVLGIK